MEKNKGCCPYCGNELSYFRTNRYLESGKAVVDCGKCFRRVGDEDGNKD